MSTANNLDKSVDVQEVLFISAWALTMSRCVLQWELSGACADENAPQEGLLKDTAAAVAEEESDGYALDMRDGSDLERDSDFEGAADERRFPVSAAYPNGKLHALRQARHWTNTIRGVNTSIHTW